jgi:hypothetical protein
MIYAGDPTLRQNLFFVNNKVGAKFAGRRIGSPSPQHFFWSFYAACFEKLMMLGVQALNKGEF